MPPLRSLGEGVPVDDAEPLPSALLVADAVGEVLETAVGVPPPLTQALMEAVGVPECVTGALRTPLEDPVPLIVGARDALAAADPVPLPLAVKEPLAVTVGVEDAVGGAAVAEGAGGRDCVPVAESALLSEDAKDGVPPPLGEPLPEALPDAVAPLECEPEGLPVVLPLPLAVPTPSPAPPLPVGEGVADGDPLPEAARAGDNDAVGVNESMGDAEGEKDTPPVAEGVGVALPQGVPVPLLADVRVPAAGDGEGLRETVFGGVGEAPREAVTKSVVEGVGVPPGLKEGVPVPGAPAVTEGEPLPVPAPVADAVGGCGVGVLLRAPVPDAPMRRDAEADSDCGPAVCVPPPVGDAVSEGSSGEGDPEGLPLTEALAVPLLLQRGDAVEEGLRVAAGVRVEGALVLALPVTENVAHPEALPLAGGVAVGVTLKLPLTERERVTVGDTEMLPQLLAVFVAFPVALALAVPQPEREGEGEAEGQEEEEAEDVSVWQPVDVAETQAVEDAETLAQPEPVADTVGVRSAVEEPDAVTGGVPEPVALRGGEGVADTEGVFVPEPAPPEDAEGEPVSAALGVALPLLVPHAVPVPVGDAENTPVSDAVPVLAADAVVSALCEAVAQGDPVPEPLRDVVPLREGEPVTEVVRVRLLGPVAEREDDPVAEGQGEEERERKPEALVEAVLLTLRDTPPEPLWELEAETLRLPVVVGVTTIVREFEGMEQSADLDAAGVGVMVSPPDALTDGVNSSDALTLAVICGEIEGLCVASMDADAEGETLSLELTLRLGAGVPETDGSPLLEAQRVAEGEPLVEAVAEEEPLDVSV